MSTDKLLIEENKKLIEKYPFLIPRNAFSGKVVKDYDYSWTELDAMPDGWRKAFGLLLCEDIMKILTKHNMVDSYRILQIKEKYGTLRWYDNGAPKELHSLLNKYEHISEYVCIECGKVNVPVYDDGWVSPFCTDCMENLHEKRYHKEVDVSKFEVSKPMLTPTFTVLVYEKGITKRHQYSCKSILQRMGVDVETLPTEKEKREYYKSLKNE